MTGKATIKLPIWELVNPSDAYTFEAPTIEIAGVIAMLLGNGYGAKRVDAQVEDDRTPILFGWTDWCEERGINDAFVEAHAAEIAVAFESFIIGNYQERLELLSILQEVPSKRKRKKLIAERQELRRTSMNNIGERAATGAEGYRKLAQIQSVCDGGSKHVVG